MELFTPEKIRLLLLFAPVFILSLSFHEYAHAWSANRLGDSTARYLGRMTMDPMSHISWFGTVLFPAISLLTGAPLFGWANPVPVDMRNFRKPRLHMAIVAAAGPASNLVLAVICTAVLSFVIHSSTGVSVSVGQVGMRGAAIEMLTMAVQMNLFLAFFNLLPVPPLDGSRIVQGFVSSRTAEWIDRYAFQGQMILLALFIFGILRILAVPVYGVQMGLFELFGLR